MTMSETETKGSATIYQFPEWPRARVLAERQQRQEQEMQLQPATVVSSAWYHAAAIEEPQAS
jgi:Protein of unknown function (DUF2735)